MNGALTAFRWELLKLRAPKRSHLGLGAAMPRPDVAFALQPAEAMA